MNSNCSFKENISGDFYKTFPQVFGNVYLLALDNTKRRGKHSWHPIAVMGVVDHLGLHELVICDVSG